MRIDFGKIMKRKRRRRRKAALLMLALFFGLLAGMVFVGTRGAFIRTVVLPHLGRVIGIEIAATRVLFSPLSGGIELHEVRVGPSEEPLAVCEWLHCRFQLLPLLQRRIWIDEVTVRGVFVDVVRHPDGSWNLPRGRARARPSTKPMRDAMLPDTDIANVRLEGGSVVVRKATVDGIPGTRIEFAEVDICLPRLANGADVDVTLVAELRQATGSDLDVTSGRVAVSAKATLRPDLRPSDVQITLRLDAVTGTIQDVDLEGRHLDVQFRADASAGGWLVREVRLTEGYGETVGTDVRLSGEVIPAEPRADLEVRIDRLGPELLNAVGSLIGDWKFGNTSARYDGRLLLSPGPVWGLRGSLHCTEASFASEALGVPKLAPLDIRLEHDLMLDRAMPSLRVNSGALTVAGKGPEHLSVVAVEPGEVALAKLPAQGRSTSAKFAVELTDMPLALIAPLLPDGVTATTDSGQVTAQLEAVFRNLYEDIALRGRIQLARGSLRIADKTFMPLDIVHDLDASLANGERLIVHEAALRLAVDGHEAGRMTASGDVNVRAGKGKFRVHELALNQHVLSALPPDLLGQAAFDPLRVEASGEILLARGGSDITIKGKVLVPEFGGAVQPGKPLPPMSAATRFNVTIGPDMFSIDSLHASASARDQRFMDLTARGRIPRPLANGPIVASLQAERVDVGTLIHEIIAPMLAEKQRELVPGEPAAVDLGGMRLSARMTVKDVTYGHIHASGGDAEVTIENNLITVSELNLTVNDALLQVTGNIDLGREGYAYRAEGTLEQADLAPLFETLAPGISERFGWKVRSLAFAGHGAGFTLPNLRHNLEAQLALDLEELYFRRTGYLDRVASATGIPHFRTLAFDTGTAELTLGDGIVHARKLELAGANLDLKTQGTMELNGRLKLAVQLGMAARLITHVRKINVLDKADGQRRYVYMPAPLLVGGNVVAPEADVIGFVRKSVMDLPLKVVTTTLETGRKVTETTLEKAADAVKAVKSGVAESGIEKLPGALLRGVKDAGTERLKQVPVPRGEQEPAPE